MASSTVCLSYVEFDLQLNTWSSLSKELSAWLELFAGNEDWWIGIAIFWSLISLVATEYPLNNYMLFLWGVVRILPFQGFEFRWANALSLILKQRPTSSVWTPGIWENPLSGSWFQPPISCEYQSNEEMPYQWLQPLECHKTLWSATTSLRSAEQTPILSFFSFFSHWSSLTLLFFRLQPKRMHP